MTRTLELKKVEVLRFANVVGLVCLAVYAVITICMLPFFLILIVAAGGAGDAVPALMIIPFAIAYPILAGIFGWIGGALGAVFYNMVSGWIGGFRFALEDGESA